MTATRKRKLRRSGCFCASSRPNAKYIPTSAEQILEGLSALHRADGAELPQLFTLLPKSPVTVEAIPAFQAAAATHYVTGTPDGKRRGGWLSPRLISLIAR